MKKRLTAVSLTLFSPMLWAFSAAELAQTLQKPQNVQGDFVQERHLKSLAKPMNARGTFVLQPKRGLLWNMQKPFETRMRVRADGITQWNGQSWVKPQGSAVGQSQQVKLFLDLLGGNTQGLEKQFDMKLGGSEKQWMLQLTPKTAVMKQIFTRIDIQGDSAVRRIELNEKQGDRTIMRFQNVKTNQGLDAFAKQAL
ncbi:LolA family protein [Neisseria chenwenguii]|uniref:Uncharacterized protein n=1 Tax=Neisseria chenwenguii TaxID=1853278 RepID=A0A220S4V2_9NEIS|nr:outer membrane lipoprotein carrier protein LolA [Neisseria chenwenguii]ASK28373.1 hypothetical protein BG910_00320 [Neisseria chenwenguii]ROV55877.1 outer membrane lipoprotein carrier protein LolA [Neisseria chenwenguii]